MVNTIICMLGLPGSGKGTQSHVLASKLNFDYVSTGNLVRAASKKGETEKEFAEIRKRHLEGTPQPDEVINALMRDKIKEISDCNGVLLDTYPLSAGQAKELDTIAQELGVKTRIVVYLDVPEEEIVKRLSERRICKETGQPATLINGEWVCPSGGEVIVRQDDKPEVVKVRLEKNKERYAGIFEYYEEKGGLIKVNGFQSVAEVSNEVLEKLKEAGIS